MPNSRSNPNPEVRHWAIIVYIAGDNDLSESGMQNIQEMCNVGASEDVHVGVEIDTIGEHTGSIRYEITKPDWLGETHRCVLERLPEQNTGDPEVLKNFLTWGFKRFPAPKRAVVIGGHGTGFRPQRRGIASDYSAPGDDLNMPEIEKACKTAFDDVNEWVDKYNSNNETKVHQIDKIQILGFDSCLMSMIEVVHHLSNFAEIIVASQQTAPKQGWPYDEVIEKAKTEKDPKDLAHDIVKEYIKYYDKRLISNVTHSAIHTEKISDVVELIGELGSALVGLLKEDRAKYRKDIRSIRIKVQAFDSPDYVDLIHLSELFLSEMDNSDIKSLASEISKAAQSCIINKPEEGMLGLRVAYANGLSIWFPGNDDGYNAHRARYMELKCNNSPKAFGWTEFLEEYNFREWA